MLANKMHRPGHFQVFDGEHLGRLPRDNPQRLDANLLGGLPLAVDQAVQQSGRLVADAAMVGHDAGQLRIGHLAERLVIVHADHGDLVRHARRPCGKPRAPAGRADRWRP